MVAKSKQLDAHNQYMRASLVQWLKLQVRNQEALSPNSALVTKPGGLLWVSQFGP